MSFKCEGCGNPQRVGSRPSKMVTEIRPVTYVNVREAREDRDYKPSKGHETVEEKKMCRPCASVASPPQSIPDEPKVVNFKPPPQDDKY